MAEKWRKVGYAIERKARPSLEDQLEKLQEYGLNYDEIRIDHVTSQRAGARHMQNRNRLIEICSERGEYEVVVHSTLCLMHNAPDLSSVAIKLLEGGCAITDLSEGKTVTRENVGISGVSEMVARAEKQQKSLRNAGTYADRTFKRRAHKNSKKDAARAGYGREDINNVDLAAKYDVTPVTLWNWFGSRDDWLDALDLGVVDYMDGKSRADNPFRRKRVKKEQHQFDAWNDGYDRAKKRADALSALAEADAKYLLDDEESK